MRASITSDAPRSGFAPADVPRFDAEATEGFERVPGTFAPESAIDEQIGELERWALANVARDRQGKLRFWVLRGVAFIGAVGAAVGAGFGYPKVALALSVCSALAVAIDAAWPSGSFRSPHQRAVHDLRELQNTLKLRWDKVRLAHPDPQARERIAHALTLLDAVQAKREEIATWKDDENPRVQAFAAWLAESLDQMIASGDFVVSRYAATGTHRGDLAGIAPTGRHAETHGCVVSEIKNGQIMRQWLYWDSAHLLRQLGVLPAA